MKTQKSDFTEFWVFISALLTNLLYGAILKSIIIGDDNIFLNKLKEKTLSANEYIITFFKWILLSAISGSIGGLVGTAFNKLIDTVTQFREENTYIILFLPLGGLLI